MTETEHLGSAEAVMRLFRALQDRDSAAAEAVLAEDVVWKNVGYPALRGRSRVLRMFMSGGGVSRFEVTVHRIASSGNTVLMERTDAMVVGWFRLQFWVCGAFDVEDGRITVWRDYFDLFDVVKGLLRGVLGIFIPSIRSNWR